MSLQEQVTQPATSEYRTIPLSQGRFAIVDAEDYEWLNQWKWTAAKSRNTFYAQRTHRGNGKRTTIFMHREIMRAANGVMVDHRFHDGLDNRKQNLRVSTNTQNQYNSKVSRRNKSGFRGVSWNSKASKWYAAIRADGKDRFLGSFDDPSIAHEAWKKAAKGLHKEFASW